MNRQKELFGIVLNNTQMLLEEAKANGVPISRNQFRKVAGEAARIHKSIVVPLDAALAEKSSSAPDFHDALLKVRSTCEESVNAVRGLKSALKNAPSLEVEASTEQTMQEESGMPSSGNNQLLWLLEVLVDYVLSYLSPQTYELRLEELMASTKKASEEYTRHLSTLESIMMRYDRPLAALSTLRQVARSEFFTQEIVLSSKKMVKASPPEGYEAGTQMPEIQQTRPFTTAEPCKERNDIAERIEKAVRQKYNASLQAQSTQSKPQGQLFKEAMKQVADEFLLSKFPDDQMDLLESLLSQIEDPIPVPALVRKPLKGERAKEEAMHCVELIKSLKKDLAFVDDIKITCRSLSGAIADHNHSQQETYKPLGEIENLSNEDVSSAIKQMTGAIIEAAYTAHKLLKLMHALENICRYQLVLNPIHKIEALIESAKLTLEDMLKSKLFTEYVPALRAAIDACPINEENTSPNELCKMDKNEKFDKASSQPLLKAARALQWAPEASLFSQESEDFMALKTLCSYSPTNRFQQQELRQLELITRVFNYDVLLIDVDNELPGRLIIGRTQMIARSAESLPELMHNALAMLKTKKLERTLAGTSKSPVHMESQDEGLTTAPIKQMEKVPSANAVPSFDDMSIPDTSKSPVPVESQGRELTTTPIEQSKEGVPSSPTLSAAELTQAGPAISLNKG